MLVPFLRWIEGRFPDLTKMMQEEGAGSRIFDFVLARDLTLLFGSLARADRSAETRKTLHASPIPSARMFASSASRAARSVSTKVARVAPRESASSPRAPLPA